VATSYERFWAAVDRSGGAGGCWPWAGPVTAAGAGVFTVRGRRTTARRYAYTVQYGDPGPLRVVRVAACPTPLCVHWDHLTVVTARAVALGNGSAAGGHGSAVCGRGHDLTAPGAVYVHPGDGRRECAVCKAVRRGDAR